MIDRLKTYGHLLSALIFTVFLLTACTSVNANPGTIVVNDTGNSMAAASVQQSGSPSIEQLQKAAQAGDADAQYALGYNYYYGKGVAQNLSVAVVWINKAAAQGQPQAVKALALIQKAQQEHKFPTGPQQTAASADTAAAKTPPTPAKIIITNKPSTTTLKSIKPVGDNVAVSSSMQLAKAPKDYFTIQLLGAYQEQDVINFIRTHNLGKQATYYRTKHSDKDWYVLVYGIYKTRQEATAAIQGLPTDIKQQKPWVNSIANVQESMAKAGGSR